MLRTGQNFALQLNCDWDEHDQTRTMELSNERVNEVFC